MIQKSNLGAFLGFEFAAGGGAAGGGAAGSGVFNYGRRPALS
jgi:hypothetical protein